MCFALLAGAFLMAGCDSAPGTEDVFQQPPVVGGLVVTPDIVAATPGAETQVEILVSFTATDANDDLDQVFVTVQASASGGAPLGQEILPATRGRQEARVLVTLPAGTAGSFPVVVTASDARGSVGNKLVGRLDVTGSSAPPEIVDIDMPDTAQRPTAGQPPVTIPIVATVTDPDGRANIARVEVVVNGSVTLLLCDDGDRGTCNAGFGSSGDETAGDGRYTLTIALAAENAAGPNSFTFKAVDRTGLESAPVTRILEVQ
ncbi:MAG: hypothetical protein COV99_10105 [Bacteroidetes bacterium CG12_big_fil_rev_8_21_14_0_65_60_17]|nr:MAG: hypothetical protein COV99_10105 [Bacteroidetes bacterium CG12_big_fil_rev_8_21_14_0_65_60_17]